MNADTSPDAPKAKPAPGPDCTFCLPFCGLGGNESLASRLLGCGVMLLEQTQAPAPGLSDSLSNS